MDYDGFQALVKKRLSIHQFLQDQIPGLEKQRHNSTL